MVSRDASDGLPTELRDQLTEMVGGAPLGSVVPITGGSQVQVWQVTLATLFGERYALRRVGRPLDLLDRQALALRDLPTNGVRLATILGNRQLDATGPKPACAQLTTWLDGSHPSPRHPRDAGAIGGALARFHHGLAGKEADFSDRPLILPSYQRYVADLTRLLDEDRPVIAGLSLNRRRVFLWEHLQESARLPTQLLHGDLHAANIVVNPDEPPGFIDFDKMMVGPRIFDLAKYIATSLFYGAPTARLARRSVDAFLAGYTDLSPLTDTEQHCLDALALLLMAETALVGTNYDLPHLLAQADAVGAWWSSRRRKQIQPRQRREPLSRPAPVDQLGLFPDATPTAGRGRRSTGGGAAPLLIAVNYHRVGPTDPGNPHHRLHAVTPDAFQAQIDLLTGLGTFVSLGDLRHPDDLDPVNIVVTFDDVPVDALAGIDVLRRAGLPYAVAVCTGLADNGHGVRDKVYAITDRYTNDELHDLLTPDFGSVLPAPDRFRFYSFSKTDALPHQVMVDEIIDPLFATLDHSDGHPGRPAYLDWDQIRALAADPLATLVNHSHSHANLQALTRAEIQADIDHSTSRFGDEVDGPAPTFFAVPFGHVDQRVCLDLLRALDPHRYEGVLWVGQAGTIIGHRPAPTIRHITRLNAPKSAAELRRLTSLCHQEPHQRRYLTEAIPPRAHRDPVTITTGARIDEVRPFERLVRENKPYALSKEYFDYQFTDNPSRTGRPAYQAVVRDDHIEAVLYNFHTTFQLDGRAVPGVYVAGWRKLPQAHHLASGLLLRKLVQQEAIVGVANPNQDVITAFTTWHLATAERYTLTTEPADSTVVDAVTMSDHAPEGLNRLCRGLHQHLPFSVLRTPELYQWRYNRYPLAPCTYLTLQDDTGSVGFGILVRAGNHWSLSDYHAPGDGAFARLVAAARHHAYEAGALTLAVQTSSPGDGGVLRALTVDPPVKLRNFYHFNQARLRELGIDLDIDEQWPTWRLHETEAAGDVLQRPEHHVAPTPQP